ncbi:olfactory receptor 5D13-like [Erinaceus europaeus]|uniref:Olfactory receptor n=1 Tax=Erinaceus europaeus TaxID=9365 RepID=A0ABM3W581_ERIEU|nr:olfactory receptor 5D13-like [Erinaceus europaeus]
MCPPDNKNCVNQHYLKNIKNIAVILDGLKILPSDHTIGSVENSLHSENQLSYFNHRNLENQSTEVTFILLGFSEYPDLQLPLFLLFLTIYTVTVLGNLGMILIIRINPKLHIPMYFFLSHLSFLDFCYSTVVTPKLLENLVVEDRTISFSGCISQFFFQCIFVVAETFMLAVMAYDRFVAVCNPLLYTTAMSFRLCSLLVGASYSWGLICSGTLTYLLVESSYRGKNIIRNFVCEHAAIASVSYSDPYISQQTILVLATFNEISTLMIILTSYVFIFITVMKRPSTGGRRKAFSTCASHLTAITIFHGTILFLYCVPNSKNSWLMVKVGSVFYNVVIPMLNPLIYSLRNKDVKETARKFINTTLVMKCKARKK